MVSRTTTVFLDGHAGTFEAEIHTLPSGRDVAYLDDNVIAFPTAFVVPSAHGIDVLQRAITRAKPALTQRKERSRVAAGIVAKIVAS